MSKFESRCADCGGWDIEWMYRCQKHGLEYCRGCSCPDCANEDDDEDEFYYDDGDEMDKEARERQDETGAFNPALTGQGDSNG